MSAGDVLKKIWANKKLRNIVILVILIIVLIITVIINFQSPEPRKSERVLICDQCKFSDMFKFINIKQEKCPKCGTGHMRYGMKCRKCDYEFPYIDSPLSEKQKKKISLIRAQRILDRRCPNCGDVEVAPISNYIWKKKHGKQ